MDICEDDALLLVEYSGFDICNQYVSTCAFVHHIMVYTAAVEDQACVEEGYEEMCARLLAESGAEVDYDRTCTDVREGGCDSIICEIGPDEAAVAHHVIVSGLRPSFSNFSIWSQERRQAMKALEAIPMLEVFLSWDRPWWSFLGHDAGKSTTDLEIRQVKYLGSDGLLIFCTGMCAQRWGKRVEMDRERAVFQMVQHIERVHGLEYLAEPTVASVRYWAAGTTYWKIDQDPEQCAATVMQGKKGDSKVLACGDGHSRHQGWVEGALESAREAVDRLLKQAQPSWQILEEARPGESS